MTSSRAYDRILLLAVAVLVLEVLFLAARVVTSPQAARARASKQMQNARLRHLERSRAQDQAYRTKIYQATGASSVERVYNRPTTSLVKAIQAVFQEAVPQGWKISVEVEEFSHFVVLVKSALSSSDLAQYRVETVLQEPLSFFHWLPLNVAFYDLQRKCVLFFDSKTLAKLKLDRPVPSDVRSRALRQGEGFGRFDSLTIPCVESGSHLVAQLDVLSGGAGLHLPALVDTGASMTVLPRKFIDNAALAHPGASKTMKFKTANGVVTFAVVRQEIRVGPVARSIEVAVDPQSEVALLGVNFFDGYDYVVDFAGAAIHLWPEN